MIFLQATVIAVCLIPAALVVLYNWGLALVRLMGWTAICRESDECTHSFAIVIPAHNEEGSIGRTLQSCFALDYPREKVQVFVVADNCTDRTAEVVRSHGATCLERHDLENRGKGQALEWAFPQVLQTPCQGILVVDADGDLDRNALRVFDQAFKEGSPVLQSNHINLNPDAGSISYAASVGNFLEYDLVFAPKSVLHLAVMLVGTGMVFRRDILERFPWHARSVTEDVEYTLLLAQNGLRVRFVSNVGVKLSAAERMDQLQPQRKRWASGTLSMGRKAAVQMIFQGLIKRSLLLMDAGWTLLIVSRPLVIAHLMLTVMLAGLLGLIAMDAVTRQILIGTGIVVLAQVAYFALGVTMLGITRHRIGLLLGAPQVVLRLAWISATSLLTFKKAQWERVPR